MGNYIEAFIPKIAEKLEAWKLGYDWNVTILEKSVLKSIPLTICREDESVTWLSTSKCGLFGLKLAGLLLGAVPLSDRPLFFFKNISRKLDIMMGFCGRCYDCGLLCHFLDPLTYATQMLWKVVMVSLAAAGFLLEVLPFV